MTNTSVNPARSLGPALVEALFGQTWPLRQVWLFLIAPPIGAALAGAAYRFIGGSDVDLDVVGDKSKR